MRHCLAALLLLPTAALAQTPAPPPPETVHVEGKAISDEAVSSFVRTFAEPSLLSGKIPRWYSRICMKTQGLPARQADAITRRVLEIAVAVGAPVQAQPCATNVVVLFERNPQALLDVIAAEHPDLLGPHDDAQAREMATMRFPVQAWYATATKDNNGIVKIDSKKPMPFCGTGTGVLMSAQTYLPLATRKYIQTISDMEHDCGQQNVAGTRLRDGLSSQMSTVTAVASLEAVNGRKVKAMADYLAMVILSQTRAFGACEQMETIANMLVPGCDTDNHINGLMPGDMAFLKALYRADTGGTLVMQQASIRSEMKKLLNAP